MESNELEKVFVLMQTFIQEGGESHGNEDTFHKYVNTALNDKQMEFYKAHVCKLMEEHKGYIVRFYFFCKWKNLSSTLDWLRDIQQHTLKDHFRKKDDVLYEESSVMRREPQYVGSDNGQSWDNVPGKNPCAKFINWWLIVPKVQWDFFNLMYQMYTFDITHQGFIPKFVHFFTIPCNVMLSVCFLAQFSFFGVKKMGYGAFELNGAMYLFIALVVLYMVMGFLRKTIAWGVATSVVVFVCWVTGNLWYFCYKTLGNPWYNPTTLGTNPIMWSYIISFIQASSHMVVPQLPPYITGMEHWESVHTFFTLWASNTGENRCKSIMFIILALACFPVLSVAVAWFSYPHLIGTEVIYIMAGIGYQHEVLDSFFRILEKAELSGNPILDHFPTKAGDLTQDSHYFERLVESKIVDKNASEADVMKAVCTLSLARAYFKPRAKVEEDRPRFDHMNHARHVLKMA